VLELSTVADQRVDRVFMHVYATILLIFVLAVAYRLFARRRSPSPAGAGTA